MPPLRIIAISSLRILLLTIACLFFSSCLRFHVNEAVVFREDGSGDAFFQLELPLSPEEKKKAQALLSDVSASINEAKGITAFRWQSSQHAELTRFNIIFSFKNIRDLPGLETLFSKSVEKHFPSLPTPHFQDSLIEMDWKLKGINQIEITRKINLPTGHLWEKIYGDSSLHFVYGFSENLIPSNAHQSIDSGQGTQLIWNFLPGKMEASTPIEITFTISPWYLLPQNTVIGILGVLTGIIGAFIFAKIRRRMRTGKKSVMS